MSLLTICGTRRYGNNPAPSSPFDSPGTSISDDQVEAVIVKTLKGASTDATHCSTRSMAQAQGMNQSAIFRIWRAFGLKPHLVDSFKLSPDPLFVETVRDIVDPCINPPEAALVRSVGERPKSKHSTAPHRSCRCAPDCPNSLRTIMWGARQPTSTPHSVPEALDIHLVVENVSTHKTPEIHRWLVRHSRFHLHFTPTYGSWMNMVERWFAELTNEWLRRGTHRSTKGFEPPITEWIETSNKNPAHSCGRRVPTKS